MKAPKLTLEYIQSEAFDRDLAKSIRAGAAFDVDAFVASGELIRMSRGWYVLRDHTVLDTVGFMVRTLQGRTVKGKSELRVQFESPKGYKKLAARLKPGY